MKKVFFRILVAAAVAFILSKMKLLGIMQVSALEVWNTTASDFCVYDTPSSTARCDTALTNRTYFGRSWKSYTYQGQTTFDSVSWYIPQTNMTNRNFHYSVAFMIWSGNTNNNSFPVRAYLNDGTNTSSCNVEGGTFGDVGYSKVYIISCENAFQGTNSVRLFITGPFETSNTLFALSTGTMLWDRDDVIALQTQNNYLQQIRNSLNDTNNKLQTMIDLQNQNNQTQTQIQNNTKETNDLIKDDSSISNDKITDITNIDTNTSNTPVSDFITLPITLLNKYNTSMNSSCNSINLGSLLGTDLIIPCINLEQRLGSNLWSIIDKLFSFFMVFNIAMFCISIFERLTSLHDDFYSAYEPQHAYNGKHGGGS